MGRPSSTISSSSIRSINSATTSSAARNRFWPRSKRFSCSRKAMPRRLCREVRTTRNSKRRMIKIAKTTTAEPQRIHILKDLKNKIKGTEGKTTEYKGKYQESLKTMSSLKEGISSILSKIAVDADGKSNNKAMMDMIKNTGVTESNVMEILGVIEQKTNDLIGKFIVVSA